MDARDAGPDLFAVLIGIEHFRWADDLASQCSGTGPFGVVQQLAVFVPLAPAFANDGIKKMAACRLQTRSIVSFESDKVLPCRSVSPIPTGSCSSNAINRDSLSRIAKSASRRRLSVRLSVAAVHHTRPTSKSRMATTKTAVPKPSL